MDCYHPETQAYHQHNKTHIMYSTASSLPVKTYTDNLLLITMYHLCNAALK